MDKDIKGIVGENLKAARLARGMTQKEVAALLNKYQPDYSQYESGKIELDYEKMVFLCNLFDITPNDLFYGIFDKD
ncbi:MAG TPA: helix-turn-helix transcriptional regulator [Candidatus Coproplasma excrementipullorum]|nr:helix-turn-helix transcriptional regulator [Candidatus Coproplasma excrementipullorum]